MEIASKRDDKSRRCVYWAFLVGVTMWVQESPAILSACDLAKDPKSFDGKTVRVRGTLSVHFEDFSFELANCDARRATWLAFGGDVPGIVASMANDSFRKPGVDIEVNDASYGINKDANFRRLYALIASRHGDTPDYHVTATLTGAFFAGDRDGLLPGYGHLGCCALFVITQVEDVESTPPANLNVRGTVLRPDGTPAQGLTVLDDVLGGLPPQTQETTTNEKGEFEFSNSGPLLRVEVPNYRPVAVAVKTGGPAVALKLEDAQRSDWPVLSCPEPATSAGRIGFSMLFVLPPTMESEPLDHQVGRTYFIFPRGGSSAADSELIIRREAGLGADRSEVVDSRRSERRWIKDSAGSVVGIDSRGQMMDGGYWRTVSFGSDEVAHYRLDAGGPTALLDKILDSACISKP